MPTFLFRKIIFYYICKVLDSFTYYIMVIESLTIKNIGPFEEAEIEFATDFKSNPITVITGKNGTGKSMVIDAIRAVMAGGQSLSRSIVSQGKEEFSISLSLKDASLPEKIETNSLKDGYIKEADYNNIARPLLFGYKEDQKIMPFIIDLWSSTSPKGDFSIPNIGQINPLHFHKDVLSGIKKNVDLVNFICHIDYLKSSDEPTEKEIGETVFSKIKEIIDKCVEGGEFLYVRRKDYQPIIRQNGFDLTLSQINSGNLFLIEHFILLLCQYYSLSLILKKPLQEVLDTTGGILLIDEIESHLHPLWQKSVLSLIRNFFPKLQIILTTHSPFILSSLPDLKIYTAAISDSGRSIISDQTDLYSSMPVDDILLSGAFGTTPFNNQITEKLRDRKKALNEGNKDDAEKINKELLEINPVYFSYLDYNSVNSLR